jgi:hypothetical protein
VFACVQAYVLPTYLPTPISKRITTIVLRMSVVQFAIFCLDLLGGGITVVLYQPVALSYLRREYVPEIEHRYFSGLSLAR